MKKHPVCGNLAGMRLTLMRFMQRKVTSLSRLAQKKYAAKTVQALYPAPESALTRSASEVETPTRLPILISNFFISGILRKNVSPILRPLLRT